MAFNVMPNLNDLDTVPDVVGLTFNGTDSCYWSAPRVRSRTNYQSGWTSNGFTNLPDDLLNVTVNNGAFDDELPTFTYDSAVGGQYVQIDFGVGNEKNVREWTYVHDTAGGTLSTVAISYHDGASWVPVTGLRTWQVGTDAGTLRTMAVTYADVGARQQLRFAPSGSGTVKFFEVWPREYGDTWPGTAGYLVFSTLSGGRQLYTYIDAASIPTAAAPLLVSQLAPFSAPTFQTSGVAILSLLICVVARGDAEPPHLRGMVSPGVSGGATAAAVGLQLEAEATLALVNGLNSNVVVNVKCPTHVITGPTGGFSVGGFAWSQFDVEAQTNPTGYIARKLRLRYAGAQACTFLEESAGSAASNRIKTDRGNIATAGAFVAKLTRSDAEDRWVLDSIRDSTGYK